MNGPLSWVVLVFLFFIGFMDVLSGLLGLEREESEAGWKDTWIGTLVVLLAVAWWFL